MEYFYLEITSGNGIGKRYLLVDGVVSVGRSPNNAIRLDSSERIVSSNHAIIYKYPESITVQDLSSTNGTYLNDKKVTQEEVRIGDEIGFGEGGPRLKLIVSNEELPTEPSTPSQCQILKTDDTEQSFSVNGSGKETIGEFVIDPCKKSKETMKNDVRSQTLEMESKLLSKKINADELNKLMNQSERVEKILQKGNLNETQTHLLHIAYSAHKKSKKYWITVIWIIVGISILLTSFFTIRILQYRNHLNKALKLEKKLDGYEEKIEKARATGAGVNDLNALVKEFEQTEGQFKSVKMGLKADDFQKLFQDTVEMYLTDIMSRFGEIDYHIPPQMIERVKYHLNVYSGQLKPIIARYLLRKSTYFPMINRVFTEKKIPLELAYVSMLESGFNPKALSPVGARGLWQFMPETGRKFSLRIDDHVDDRIDPEKATFAAAEFFKDLISIFGAKSSVMLVMASYNAGENRVMGALRKIDDPMRNRDFWYIYRMGYLAEETNEYIPRVLALMIIDEHQEQYGFAAQNRTVENLEDEHDFVPQ